VGKFSVDGGKSPKPSGLSTTAISLLSQKKHSGTAMVNNIKSMLRWQLNLSGS